jgi:hypothetical protein
VQVSGPLPDSWAQLSLLKTLDLTRNRLSGSIPPFWCDQVTSGCPVTCMQCTFSSHLSLDAIAMLVIDMVQTESFLLRLTACKAATPSRTTCFCGMMGLHPCSSCRSAPGVWPSLNSFKLSNNRLNDSLPGQWAAPKGLLYSADTVLLSNNQFEGVAGSLTG